MFGILTQFLLAEALRRETAVTVALVAQFQVVPAALCELIAFGSTFDGLSAVGATLTTVSGVIAIVSVLISILSVSSVFSSHHA